MGFLGIGTWEILLIIILALILLGPNRLTETAKTLGKIVRSIRKTSAEFTAAVTREMNQDEDESPSKDKKPAAAPSDTEKKEPGKDATESPDRGKAS